VKVGCLEVEEAVADGCSRFYAKGERIRSSLSVRSNFLLPVISLLLLPVMFHVLSPPLPMFHGKSLYVVV
jgi:hypothetical protein